MSSDFIPFQFLTADELNAAFDDCVSISAVGTQTLASTINLPSLIATISIQTQQLSVTGDLVCTSASAITMPVGTTLERPNVPTFGMIRANSDSGLIEVLLQSGSWANLDTSAAVSTPTNPPVSMSGPSFGQATSSAIPIGWSNPTGGTGPFNFSVQYRLAGTASWTTWIQQTPAFSTTISGLLDATRYEVQVTAFNAAGSATSPIAATNTLGFVSGGVTNLTASLPTSTSISLTWVPATVTSAYQVQYALQGAPTWTDFNGPLVGSSAVVTGLVPNSTYNFQVVSLTLGTTSESLVAQSATTVAATVAPNTATQLLTGGVNTSGFTVSWQPPSAGTQPMIYASQYQLNGTATWTTYFTTTQLSVTFTDLNSASGYSVRVISTNSAGQSISTAVPVTTSTAIAATGTVAGTQNSGPNYPQMIAPALGSAIQSSALAITGITVIDPIAIYSSGTLVLTVTCSLGTVTMTDTNNSQIIGSGTNTIKYSGTLAGVQTALASLVYTAATSGADNISVTLVDQLINQSSLSIPVTVAASASSPSPTPPPGGGSQSNVTATGQPTDINGTQANRARSFTDRVGVCVRLEDPGYNENYSLAQAAVIENMINYLATGNLTLLREECGPNINPSFLSQIATNCGRAKYDLYIGPSIVPSSYVTILLLMQIMAEDFPSVVSSFEGAFGTSGLNLESAAQFQTTLYPTAHTFGLPAWQLAPLSPSSNTTFGSPPADLANTVMFPPFSPNGTGSPYYSTDSNGYMVDAVNSAKTATAGVPCVISEFGWQSFPDGTTNNGLGLVPESVQAAYILETMLSAYKLGVVAFCVNELLDVLPGFTAEDVGQTYGLFNSQGTQKVSATALRNLMTNLADNSPSATSFSAGKLNYTVTNKPGTYGGFVNTGYQEVLFQVSFGTYWLIMWNEQALNTLGGNNVPISIPVQNVTLTFNETAKSNVLVVDPLNGDLLAIGTNVSSISIPLPAHPIIVKVTF